MSSVTPDGLQPVSRTAASAPHAFGRHVTPTTPARAVENLEIVRRYLAAIEADTSGGPPSDSAAFFAADAVQVEFPNRLVPAGARRDLAALRDAAARGRTVLRGQRYEVRAAYAVDDTVILEVLWVGTLAVPVGGLTPGEEMRAHFAVFVELRDGRIHRQRNYDCFEPF
jgi:ketosteroid isomerase-like protein